MEKIESAISAVVEKASALNQEYALTGAVKDLLAKAGNLSVEAIDSALKFAEEKDLKGQLKAKIEELAAKTI